MSVNLCLCLCLSVEQLTNALEQLCLLLALAQSSSTGEELTVFGGTIFTKADRDDINDIEDLSGKTLSAVSINSLGGLQMQWGVIQQHGLHLLTHFPMVSCENASLFVSKLFVPALLPRSNQLHPNTDFVLYWLIGSLVCLLACLSPHPRCL